MASFYDRRSRGGRGFYGATGSTFGSRGMGPDLVTNGGFGADTDWTKGTGWTIGSGVASITATGSPSNLSQNIGLVTGRIYQVTVTATVSAGGVAIYAGIGGASFPIFASGTYTRQLQAAGNATLYLQAGATFTGTIDNVSVRAIG